MDLIGMALFHKIYHYYGMTTMPILAIQVYRKGPTLPYSNKFKQSYYF
jgi:hypothetical protein